MSKQDQLQQQNPNAPWLWNNAWKEGVIRTSAKTTMLVGVGIAVFWNSISWVFVLLMAKDFKSENYFALVALIFPLVGIGLAVMAFRAIRRYMKFGESTFQLACNPGVVGGELVGVIKTSAKIVTEDGYRLTLNCIRCHVSGSGKNRRVSEEILWQSMQRISRPLDPNSENETAVPVQFGVPFECEPCTPDQSISERIYWKLEIAADQPGVDFHADFDIPVFKTEDSDPNFQLDTSLVDDFVHQPSVNEIYEEARLNRQSTVDQLTIEFPFLRDVKSAMSTTLFMTIWFSFTGGFGYALVSMGEFGFAEIMGLLFVSLFGVFGLLIASMAFDLWMWRGRITTDQNGIETKHSRLLSTTKMTSAEQIKEIFFKRTTQTGNSVFFDLMLKTTAGETITIGKRIQNEAACRAIVEDIAQHLGFESSNSHSESPDDSIEPQPVNSAVFPSVNMPTGCDTNQSQ